MHRAVEQAAVFAGDFSGDPSRRDMARRAFRRAGAGRNRLPGIVGECHETERFRLFPQRFGLDRRPANRHQRPLRRGPDVLDAKRLRRFRECFQQVGGRVAEGQGDAEGNAAVSGRCR